MYLTLDRDEFIEILWGNITEDYHSQYYKNDPSEVLGYGPYDYGSVMHYPDWGFVISWDLKSMDGTVTFCQYWILLPILLSIISHNT